MKRIKAFFKRKNVVLSPTRYFIDAMGAMAQGLFCTLLVGTIIDTIGTQFKIDFLTRPLFSISNSALLGGKTSVYSFGNIAQLMVGIGIAVAVGNSLKAPPLVLFSLIPVGYVCNAMGGSGGALAVYLVAIVASEAGKLISKETKIDILVTPIVTIAVGIGLSVLIARPVGIAANAVGEAIVWATELQPFLMGIVVSVLMGIALTLPISSAAICAAFGLVGLAGGAAVAGCCAQMVGFAVMSFRENRWGGLVAQGIGTSMLQMPNIVKNPRIWIPPILTSAITGPLATCVFHLKMNGAAVNSGMGTCGLCGQIGIWTGWSNPSDAAIKAGEVAMTPGVLDWVGLVLICFILPAVLTWLFAQVLRKIGWIKENDLKLAL